MNRSLIPLAASLALLASRMSDASTSFPDVVRSELGMSRVPDCLLCHDTNLGGLGTANRPFGQAVKSKGALFGNEASLRAALQAIETAALDSDSDGTTDVD